MCSSSPVSSSFLNLMPPLLALVLPQIRSSSVVLPAPLGPDDHAQLVLVDIEGQAVDGLEAVEGDRQVFDGHGEVGVAHDGLLGFRRFGP